MKFVRVAIVLAALGAGLLIVPKDSGAHCLPGNIHMHGYIHYEWGDWCNRYDDTGCIYIGTYESDNTTCVDMGSNGQCFCWVRDIAYSCDGC
jgi:hypothetical protein